MHGRSEVVTSPVSQSNLLTDGPIARTLLQFAFPILCMNVLQVLSGSVSAFWVGRYLGEAALTAVANAQSIMFLLTGAALGIAAAATILVGQCIGAGKLAEAKQVVSTGAIVFLILSAGLSIAGVALAEPMLVAMETSDESLALAVSYTRMMFLALPLIYLYLFVMSILLGAGDSRTPLWSMFIAAALGAVLNPLFIFGIGPVRGMGIVGSALATLVAQAVSLMALIKIVYRRCNPLCIYKNDLAAFRVDWSIVSALIRKGIPMGAQVLVVSLSAVLMIVLVNRFGVETTAAYGASIQLWSYIQLPAISIAIAVSSIAAQSVGAQNWDRVKETARVGVVSCVVVTAIAVLMVYAADSYAYRLFLPADSPALHIASNLNKIVMWSFVFLVIAVVLFGVMRAAGVVMAPLFIHTFSLFGVRFPLAVLLIDRWHADAIWWSFSISCAVDFVLAALYYRYGGWQGAARLRVGELTSPRV